MFCEGSEQDQSGRTSATQSRHRDLPAPLRLLLATAVGCCVWFSVPVSESYVDDLRRGGRGGRRGADDAPSDDDDKDFDDGTWSDPGITSRYLDDLTDEMLDILVDTVRQRQESTDRVSSDSQVLHTINSILDDNGDPAFTPHTVFPVELSSDLVNKCYYGTLCTNSNCGALVPLGSSFCERCGRSTLSGVSALDESEELASAFQSRAESFAREHGLTLSEFAQAAMAVLMGEKPAATPALEGSFNIAVEDVGPEFERIRNLAEISPSELHKETGISRSTINNTGKGKDIPTLKTLRTLSEAVGYEVTVNLRPATVIKPR